MRSLKGCRDSSVNSKGPTRLSGCVTSGGVRNSLIGDLDEEITNITAGDDEIDQP